MLRLQRRTRQQRWEGRESSEFERTEGKIRKKWQPEGSSVQVKGKGDTIGCNGDVMKNAYFRAMVSLVLR